jgi:hypothetical protein
MQTYDWPWVEKQVDQTIEVWSSSAGAPPPTRQYTTHEQQRNEQAYDQALLEVETALRRQPVTQERIVASFAKFAANALGLDREATNLLTTGFIPIGVSLAQRARRFDAGLSMPSIIQAARNAWTACGLQPLLGVPLELTPSILAYSLMYPYSDNFLDDTQVPAQSKKRFSDRFRLRLRGETIAPENHQERSLWALAAMVETQFPRGLYPDVFDCLLAIHRAQEQSVAQVQTLRTSCAKGGASVVADACLAYGSLTNQESRFAFEWGVLLQLGDDLQDVREDLRLGSISLFTRAASEGRSLDALTLQLLKFSNHVSRRMDTLPGGAGAFKELLTMSWTSLIIGAVADSREFFSAPFLREAERHSPFRFDFLRARKESLAKRQGLYAKLFNALLESPNLAAACSTGSSPRPAPSRYWPSPRSAESEPSDYPVSHPAES